MGKLRSARRVLLVAGVSITASVGTGVAIAASASTTSATGEFRLLDVSSKLGADGNVTLTGAIGDYGRSLSANRAGKAAAGGNYVKLALSHGTLLLAKRRLDKAIGNGFGNASLDKATCSISVTASGRLPIVSGTGMYAGAMGSAHVTVALGVVVARYKSGSKAGKCNFSNKVKPLSAREIVYGTGHVSF